MLHILLITKDSTRDQLDVLHGYTIGKALLKCVCVCVCVCGVHVRAY